MVVLSKIHTRTGDDGTTKLGNGKTVEKDSSIIEAYATIDELNAHMGLLLYWQPNPKKITEIMQDLFEMGADICTEQEERIAEEDVEKLENWIDEENENLESLNSFVLPVGNQGCCQCHITRTVCRRAERRLVAYARKRYLAPVEFHKNSLKYLNRLSDYLFVLARSMNGCNEEILWEPRKR